jgi:predicted metal-dependent phosphoesterase TrpH
MKFADLHLHTAFSDGTYSPEELIRQAARKKLAAIAVTDHDTVDGVELARESGAINDIEVLSGIELTAEEEGQEIHMLGYLIDYKNGELIKRLDFLKKKRVERIYKIVDKLKDLGLNLKPESVFDIAGKGTVSRLHVAKAMVADGLVTSIYEAFKNYIGDKCPAYVLGFSFSSKNAIALIKESGGIPVLAHPYVLGRDDLIPKFVDYGLMGLEAYYTEHTHSMTKNYLRLAKKYNLLVTGGSDCHGNAKSEVKIGSIKIPYELVEKLKQKRGLTPD